MIRISEIQQFSDCSETFQGNFCTLGPRFESSGILVESIVNYVERQAPKIYVLLSSINKQFPLGKEL